VLAAHPPNDSQTLDAAFERALARSPRPRERESLLDFLTAQRRQYGAAPEDAAKLMPIGNLSAPKSQQVELASWTQVCRVILNLHETITRY
jgi:hypothetical protein